MIHDAIRDKDILFRIHEKPDGYHCLALYHYYPLKEFKEIFIEAEMNRNFIWDFKNWRNTEEAAIQVANAMHNSPRTIDLAGLPNWHLSIIPASTREKTEKRFKPMVNYMCDLLGVQNGYSFIRLAIEHDEMKGEKNKNVLRYFKFADQMIRGKNIYLFDDVMTTGESFRQCAGKLKGLGASRVIGVFLGKTYSSYRSGSPGWMNKDL